MGDHSQALSVLATLSRESERGALVAAFTALAWLDQCRLDEAEAVLQPWLERQPVARLIEAFYLLILLERKRYPEAAQRIVRGGVPDSIHFKPRLYLLLERQNWEAWQARDMALIRSQLAAARTAVEASSEPVSYLTAYDAGVSAYERQEYIEAMGCFWRAERALQRDTQARRGVWGTVSRWIDKLGQRRPDFDLWIAFGEVYSALGCTDEAEGYHARVRERDPKDPVGRLYAGKHAVRAGRPADAARDLESLYADCSNFGDCFLDIGIAWIAQGDFRRARAALARNLSLDADTFPLRLRQYLKRVCNIDYGRTP